MTKRLYEVQTRMQSGWYNEWFDEDEHFNKTPTYFESREEAQVAIDKHVSAMKKFYKEVDPADYRICLIKLDDVLLTKEKR